MTSPGTRTIEWANGEDQVCISKVAEVFDLEEKCQAGIFAIAGRLQGALNAFALGELAGQAYFNDVRETIRLGLIGGGMAPDKALAAVKRWVDPPNPLGPNLLIAYEIIAGYLRGVPGDQVGKKPEAEAASVSTTTTADSADPPSSDSEQDSTGPQERQSNIPSGKSVPLSTDTTSRTAASPNLTP